MIAHDFARVLRDHFGEGATVLDSSKDMLTLEVPVANWLETARTLTDRGKRNDAYFEFQRIFAEEVPSLILFHPVYTYGVSREVFEVQLPPMDDPSDRFITSSDWYMYTQRVIYSDANVQEEIRP